METRSEQLILFISKSAMEAEERNELELAATLDRVAITLIERTAYFSPQFFFHLIIFAWRFGRYITTRYLPTFIFHLLPHMWNYLVTFRDQGKEITVPIIMAAYLRAILKAYDDTSITQPAKTIFKNTMEGKEYNPGEYLTPSGQLKKQKWIEFLKEQGITPAEAKELFKDSIFLEIQEKVFKEYLKEKGYTVRKRKGQDERRNAMVLTAAGGNAAKVAADFVKNRISNVWMRAALKRDGDELANYVSRGDKNGFSRKLTASLKKVAARDVGFKRKLFLAVRKSG